MTVDNRGGARLLVEPLEDHCAVDLRGSRILILRFRPSIDSGSWGLIRFGSGLGQVGEVMLPQSPMELTQMLQGTSGRCPSTTGPPLRGSPERVTSEGLAEDGPSTWGLVPGHLDLRRGHGRDRGKRRALHCRSRILLRDGGPPVRQPQRGSERRRAAHQSALLSRGRMAGVAIDRVGGPVPGCG